MWVTFFLHNPLRALSCVFRPVYFAYIHVLSFSHLTHIKTLTKEKDYESTIHSQSPLTQSPLAWLVTVQHYSEHYNRKQGAKTQHRFLQPNITTDAKTKGGARCNIGILHSNLTLDVKNIDRGAGSTRVITTCTDYDYRLGLTLQTKAKGQC